MSTHARKAVMSSHAYLAGGRPVKSKEERAKPYDRRSKSPEMEEVPPVPKPQGEGKNPLQALSEPGQGRRIAKQMLSDPKTKDALPPCPPKCEKCNRLAPCPCEKKNEEKQLKKAGVCQECHILPCLCHLLQGLDSEAKDGAIREFHETVGAVDRTHDLLVRRGPKGACADCNCTILKVDVERGVAPRADMCSIGPQCDCHQHPADKHGTCDECCCPKSKDGGSVFVAGRCAFRDCDCHSTEDVLDAAFPPTHIMGRVHRAFKESLKPKTGPTCVTCGSWGSYCKDTEGLCKLDCGHYVCFNCFDDKNIATCSECRLKNSQQSGPKICAEPEVTKLCGCVTVDGKVATFCTTHFSRELPARWQEWP